MAEYSPAEMERVRKPEVEVAAPAQKERPALGHPLLSLQARAGNQAIARMIQRAAPEDELQMRHDPALQREEAAEEEEEELQAKHDPALQREEAAEEEEEQIQGKHDPSLQREEAQEEEEEQIQGKHDPALQRAEEEELQPKHDTAPQVGLEGGPVGADIENQINGMRGQGSSLPEGIKRQMEGATGADLGGVRVHEGNEADSLNRQLTAKAFTTGNDIFLRSDTSSGDSQLMAHELAHVVQQSSGRTSSGGSGMAAGAANDPLEAEADDLAHSALSGTAQRHAEEIPA